MNEKPGIYLKNFLDEETNKIIFYVFGTTGTQVKYLYKDGKWYGSLIGPLDDLGAEQFNGHFSSREEAINSVQKYTGFKMIYETIGEEDKELFL